jgi:hypothetical protein
MQLPWIEMKDRKPEDGEWCLTDMKHGFISGCYSEHDDTFSGYYWRDMEWTASRWVPVESIK